MLSEKNQHQRYYINLKNKSLEIKKNGINKRYNII